MKGWKIMVGGYDGGSYFVALILEAIIVLIFAHVTGMWAIIVMIFAHVTGMWDIIWMLGRKIGESL